MMREDRVFVGLGANIGEPLSTVVRAMDALGELSGTRVLERSSLYRSTPVGVRDQPDFINAVARLATELDPDALLQALLGIERRHGRVRMQRNGPRTLDLDLLMYGDRVQASAQLTLPHPRMHERAFVLLPLIEIDPDCIVPERGAASHLLELLPDQGVNRIHAA